MRLWAPLAPNHDATCSTPRVDLGDVEARRPSDRRVDGRRNSYIVRLHQKLAVEAKPSLASAEASQVPEEQSVRLKPAALYKSVLVYFNS